MKSTTTEPVYNKEYLARIKKMNDLAPEVMKAFWAFDKAAVAEGAIPLKFTERFRVSPIAYRQNSPAVE